MVVSAVFVEPVVSVAEPPVTALVVDAAVAIAAAAIVSGVPELPDLAAAAAASMLRPTGGSAAIGTCATVIGLVAAAAALASEDWLASVELSVDELSLLFEPSDFVLPPLACEAELPPLLLLLSPLFASVCELPGSLLLAGGLLAWFGWLWLAADAPWELLLLGVFRFGPELSLAERCGGGGGGGCCAGGSRFEGSGGWLLSTIEAKLLASCEATGRAALSAALGAAFW